MKKVYTLNGQLIKKPKKDYVSRKTTGETIVFIIAAIILWSFALSYIAAYLWGALAGLKSHTDLIMNPFKLPVKWKWENYVDVFSLLEVKKTNMIGMIGNTLWLVFGGTSLGIAGVTLMAYAVTRYEFIGRKALITINIITMTLPIIGSLPAQYAIFTKLGLYNSPLILWA